MEKENIKNYIYNNVKVTVKGKLNAKLLVNAVNDVFDARKLDKDSKIASSY